MAPHFKGGGFGMHKGYGCKLAINAGLLLLGLAAGCARPTPISFRADAVFPISNGQFWTMGDQRGNKTFFHVQGLPSYEACQTGEFINLRITKAATESYWPLERLALG